MTSLGTTQPCRGCDANIRWLQNEHTGKYAPIDAEPAPDGNIIINISASNYRVATAVERETAGDWLHINHFVTCPNAERFHKGGR